MTKLNSFFEQTRKFWFATRLLIALLFFYVAVYSLFTFPGIIKIYISTISLIIFSVLILIARKEMSNKTAPQPFKIFIGICSVILGLIFGYYSISAMLRNIGVGAIFGVLSFLQIGYGIFEVQTAK